jgi:CHAD domain-containing protein
MGYRLIQDEALPRGLRRIARDEIDAAIDQLGTKDASKRDQAIHEARKSIKKLRGLVRMLAPVLGPSAKTDVAALGALGRTLSEFRDAAALLETVDLLGHHCRSEQVLEQLAQLRRTLRRRAEQTCERSDLRIVLEQGIVGLRHLKRGTATWKFGEGFAVIEPGLEKTFRRGRRALKLVREAPAAESFHDLRKRVKDRWYQVRILEGLWPHPAQSPEKPLRDLQEDLGDDHNLEVLRASVPADSSALLEMVDAMQKGLRQRSLAAALLLYDRKPRDFMLELKSLWAEWHPAPSSELPSPKRAKAATSAPSRASSAA